MAERIGKAGEKLFYLGGIKGEFTQLANKHYRKLEKELGNTNPEPLYHASTLTESGLKK